MGMAEVNLNLQHMTSAEHWKARTRFWPKHFALPSYNTHATNTSKRLFGGTATMARGNLCNGVVEAGTDPKGLGRWSWIRIRGRRGRHLRIVTGYRPVKDNRDATSTVYAQHEQYLLQQDDDRDPREAFVRDLEMDLLQFLDQGDQLVLLVDVNENVRQGPFHRMVRQLPLRDCHHELHPELPTVATCDKNRSNTPIDAIWASPSVELVQAGYLAFMAGQTMTDHRLLWVDIVASSVLGDEQQPPTTPKVRRRLNHQDPRTIQKYNRSVKRQFKATKLPQKLFALQARANENSFTLEDQTEYDKLAAIDWDIRKAADKKCRKLRFGAVPNSKEVLESQSRIQLWRMLIALRTGKKASHTTVRRLMHWLKEPTAYHKTLGELERALAEALTAWRRLKKTQKELRDKSASALLEAQATHRRISTDAAMSQRDQRKQQKRTALNTRFATGKLTSNKGFSILEAPVPGQPDHRQLCTSRATIEEACFEEGRRRYSQTEETPCLANTRLKEGLGLLGTGPLAKATLEGRIPTTIDEVDTISMKFLHQLKKDPAVPMLDFWLDATTHAEGWKKMRATTQSDPMSPGMVDYVASSSDAELADIDATFATIPLQCGFSPALWKRATDVMIPKKQDSFAVEKLRIIVLFNALFNMVNKRVGRDMLRNAEQYNSLPPEAYGSRKRHRASECALNKVLTTDILRLTRRSAILCSNDAKSCYDRIVHPIASMCMQRMGVPPKVCEVIFGTIQQMQHAVRTIFGDSDATYGCIQLDNPLQGVLQGNGAGPAIWLVVSTPIIEMLRTEGYGLKVTTTLSNDRLHFVCYTFVDDTDLVHSVDYHVSAPELLAEFQNALDLWEGGLRTTGGALVASKSYWYYIAFHWERDRWQHSRLPVEMHRTITIRGLDGTTREPLLHLPVTEARETLGVWIAMDGNQKRQYTELATKMETWADHIRISDLNGYDAWFALMQCIYKTLEYPLVTTAFSPAQCQAIIRPLMKAALPKLKLASSTPRAILHADPQDGGVGIPDVWLLQGLHKLWTLFTHGSSPSITGLQIRATYEAALLQMGTFRQLLVLPYERLQALLPHCWLKSCWQFVDSTELNVQTPATYYRLAPSRLNDISLMDWWAERTDLSNQDLKSLNICRIWLRVISVADICSGDGSTILPHFFEGTRKSAVHWSFHWPPQGKPSKGHWTIWKRALELMMDQPRTRSIRESLRPTEWITSSTQPLFSWWLDTVQNRLYYISPIGPLLYLPTNSRRTRQAKFQRADPTTEDSEPSSHRLERTQHFQHPDGSISITGSVSEFSREEEQDDLDVVPVHQLHQWSTEYLRGKPAPSLLEAIRDGQAVAVCDGSYKEGYGTAAFVIQESLTTNIQIVGCNRTPGSADDMSSYRSELGGIMGILQVTLGWCEQYGLERGHMTIACDCYSALQRIQQSHLEIGSPDYDLMVEIKHLQEHHPFSWTWYHVKGHQDNHQRFEDLDAWAQLNVQTDSLAKYYWNCCFAPRTDEHVLPHRFDTPFQHLWLFSLNGERLNYWNRTKWYQQLQSPTAKKYWSQKGWAPIPEQRIQSIDWKAGGNALRALSLWQKIRVLKWNTNNTPTHYRMLQRRQMTHQRCPRCLNEPETQQHVLQCPDLQAGATWEAALHELDQWLLSSDTDPQLRRFLLTGLRRWRLNQNPPRPCGKLRILHNQLDEMGWASLFTGFLSLEWQAVQQRYYAWRDSRRTGARWVTLLIKKLWGVAWNMWDQRCGVVNATETRYDRFEHDRLNGLIQQEYQFGFQDWRPTELRWATRPLEELFQEPRSYKKEWLEQVEVIRARLLRRPLLDSD